MHACKMSENNAQDEPLTKKPRSDQGENTNGSSHTSEMGEPEIEVVNSSTKRTPLTHKHKLSRYGGKFHLLIGVTGSVAAIKLKELIENLQKFSPKDRLLIKVVTTECGMRFIEKENLLIEEIIYEDKDEWNMWQKRGDPVLHIELRKWADAMVIAPLDANTLAKIANGLCDNLLTSVVRAWDNNKTLYFAPAMNSCMWDSPITFKHRAELKDFLRFKEIPPIEKNLMCGETGIGAMATVQLIATMVAAEVKSKFAVYSS